MAGHKSLRGSDIALACSPPASERAWQRSCERAQDAMTEYLRQRCKAGHSAHAQLFGGVIALAAYAKSLLANDRREEGAAYLIDAIKAVLLDDPAAVERAGGDGDG